MCHRVSPTVHTHKKRPEASIPPGSACARTGGAEKKICAPGSRRNSKFRSSGWALLEGLNSRRHSFTPSLRRGPHRCHEILRLAETARRHSAVLLIRDVHALSHRLQYL